MRPSHNPARAARRKTELRGRLDSERPVCMFCGCTEPAILRRVSRKLLEEHHPLGRNNDADLTVFACLNCHALAHEALLDAGVDLRLEPDPRRRVAKMLLAAAVHFEMLAKTFRWLAALLEGDRR